MKDEYDFSKAERGKFFRPGAALRTSVHLEPQVMEYLAVRAEAKGVTIDQLVNDLLQKDIELIKAAS